MKKTILLVMILAFVATVNAQTSDKKWGFGAGVGGYGRINGDKANLGLMPELFLSRYLSPRLDLVFKNDLGLWRSDRISNVDLANPLINLRYKLSKETNSFRPYIYGGPGFLANNRGSGLNFDLGLGGKYYFNPATAFYIEAGYINGIEVTNISIGLNKVHDNFMKATIGLEFDFGKVKDSDMDGVSDKKDKCPDTPAGVAVDAKGCPIDTDGDGVADYIDDCPTVAGLVALKGCPDSDGDGVADKNDKCPDTPKGVKVDVKGCPIDSDGDGVADYEDKCPDTPKGVKVDVKGCPIDTDGDGVPDYLDDCPTVAGPQSNKGCPVVEKAAVENVTPEMTIEPVYFEYDKSDIQKIERAKIEKLVKLLKSSDVYLVNMTGNADSKGTEEYNMKLSERRIASVVKAITAAGVKKTHIAKQKALGESNPAATNDTEEGRALNRRVEFEVIKTK
jgi:OOP family OmpA-OmpF porin